MFILDRPFAPAQATPNAFRHFETVNAQTPQCRATMIALRLTASSKSPQMTGTWCLLDLQCGFGVSKVPTTLPQALTGQQWSGTQYVDAYKRNRQPTPNELMAELKNTAWPCISLNSAVCANNPPQLYVLTDTEAARLMRPRSASAAG